MNIIMDFDTDIDDVLVRAAAEAEEGHPPPFMAQEQESQYVSGHDISDELEERAMAALFERPESPEPGPSHIEVRSKRDTDDARWQQILSYLEEDDDDLSELQEENDNITSLMYHKIDYV